MDISYESFLKGGGVVLTLPRHRNRYEYTLQKLQEAGFENLRPFEGIDGFEADLPKEMEALGFHGRFDEEIAAKPGHIACTLSHIKIWKMIVDEKLPYCLIFEDDALPHPEFRTLARTWWNLTPKMMDLVLIGNQMDTANTNLVAQRQHIVSQPAYCLHAYVLSQKGAQRLLDLTFAEPKMKMNDVQVARWMSEERIHYVCWNGTWLSDRRYETFTEHMPIESVKTDMIVERRDTGLIYQNFLLGHTLMHKDLVYNIVRYGES